MAFLFIYYFFNKLINGGFAPYNFLIKQIAFFLFFSQMSKRGTSALLPITVSICAGQEALHVYPLTW